MQEEQEDRGIEVAQRGAVEVALDIWRRRKWLAIFIFIEVFAAITSVVIFLPNVYQSTATILVERQQVPEAFVKATVTGSLDIRLQTITQEVLSRSRIEDLINRFDLYQDVRKREPIERVIETMRKDIAIEQTQLSRGGNGTEATVAFTVSYKGKDPQKIAQVTNTIASFYIDENLKVRERQAAGTAEFLSAQLKDVKRELEEQEKNLSEFKERHMGELPEQLGSNLTVLERLNTQLRLNGERLARSNEQRTALAKQLTELESLTQTRKTKVLGLAEPAPDPKAVRLAKLQQDLAALRERFHESYPDIALLKSEIAALEQQPARTTDASEPKEQETEVPVNPYIQQLKKEFAALEVEIKALHYEEQNLLSSIQLYQQRVENAPRRDQELQLLLRDYETAKSRYQSLLKRDEEARLAESLEQRQKGEQFRLLEPALAAKKPIKPDRRKAIVMGFCLALGLAGGVAFLREQWPPSFHTARELEAFAQVPVLVSLPYIVTQAEIRQKQWRFCFAIIGAVVLLGLSTGGSYVLLKKPAKLTNLYTHLRGVPR